ncbi:MAG: hypothetical protein AAF487_00620 [Bacteroidota bacterium]
MKRGRWQGFFMLSLFSYVLVLSACSESNSKSSADSSNTQRIEEEENSFEALDHSIDSLGQNIRANTTHSLPEQNPQFNTERCPVWLEEVFASKKGNEFVPIELEDCFLAFDSILCAFVRGNSGVHSELHLYTFKDSIELDRALIEEFTDHDLGSTFYSEIKFQRKNLTSFYIQEFNFSVPENELINGHLPQDKILYDFELEQTIEKYLLQISPEGKIVNEG